MEGGNAPPPAYNSTQPPPAYQYQPAQGYPQQTTTVVYQQPAPVFTATTYRESPVRIKCPGCQAEVTTSTTYEVGSFAWIACLVIAFLGFWLGCCLIPFCIDGCKDVVHICPNCRMQVGRFNRM